MSGAMARSQVRSYADSHRPGKFLCPEVQSFHSVQNTLHSKIVNWCKCVRSRYGFKGVRVGEATNPGPPKRLHRMSANRFEILPSEDNLEVPQFRPLQEQFQRSRRQESLKHHPVSASVRLPSQFVQTGGVGRGDCGRRISRRAECGPQSGVIRDRCRRCYG